MRARRASEWRAGNLAEARPDEGNSDGGIGKAPLIESDGADGRPVICGRVEGCAFFAAGSSTRRNFSIQMEGGIVDEFLQVGGREARRRGTGTERREIAVRIIVRFISTPPWFNGIIAGIFEGMSGIAL